VREKEVISDEATVGIYNYRHWADFITYARQMIEKDIRVNNEFYVAPVYNEMIADGKRVGFCDVSATMVYSIAMQFAVFFRAVVLAYFITS